METEEPEITDAAVSLLKPKTPGEVFTEWFPFYLNAGMTYDQYWHGDPWLVCDYLAAYQMRRDDENYFLWLSGAYTCAAVSTALANTFRGKGKPPIDYLKEPIPIREKTEEELEEEKRKQALAIMKKFESVGKAWKEKHKNNA